MGSVDFQFGSLHVITTWFSRTQTVMETSSGKPVDFRSAG